MTYSLSITTSGWFEVGTYWTCPRCGEANGARRTCYACGWPTDG